MSPVVIKSTYTAGELRQSRERLLATLGITRQDELAKIARRRMLSEEEEAVAYELESIAFLLGEEPFRVD